MLPGSRRCWAAYTGDSWSSKRRFILRSCSGMHCTTAKLLRPLLTACPSRREPRAQQGGPRTARSIGPPKGTGSLLSAKEAVTGSGAQTGKEGGREGNSEGGRGGGEDGETVSAASTAAAASLLPGKSRPLRRPAPQRKDSTSLHHRLYYPPVKGLANRCALPADCPPFPPCWMGRGAARLLHAPIGGERP